VLDPSNKGFKMMAKLGFKPGDALGKPKTSSGDANNGPSASAPAPESAEVTSPSFSSTQDHDALKHTEPLRLVFKEDRGGIGLDDEKKRKFRDEVKHVAKKSKAEEGEYRDRVRLEREERRAEAQFRAAQKIAEKLDDEVEESGTTGEACQTDEQSQGGKETDTGDKDAADASSVKTNAKVKPTRKINILYRGLVRERQEKERAILDRQLLDASLSSIFVPNPQLPSYDDDTLDRHDKHALGLISNGTAFLEQELEEEDPELDEFNALDPQERLQRAVMYLRDTYQYCFWCKHQYESDEMEGCPGTTEDDHD
jgi:hypothetical protein